VDTFGERLRKLRKEKDITQGQLAEVLGVVPSAVGKYERLPQAYPSVEALIKISEYFDVSIDYLLKGVQAEPMVENNINGQLSNSPFIQANHNGVIFTGGGEQILSPESVELLHIYETLSGRDRLKLLNFAVELENEAKS
jgi:transcriptional regulator with XRE-family HTH domain